MAPKKKAVAKKATAVRKQKPKPSVQPPSKPKPSVPLYSVYFSNPYTTDRCFVVAADNPDSAREWVTHFFKSVPYLKIHLDDTRGTEAIFLSESLTITKVELYKP